MRRIGRRAGWVAAWAAAVLVAAPGEAQTPPAATEAWDAVYIAGSKVGHIKTKVAQVEDRGRKLVRVQVDTTLTFKRGDDTSTMELQYGTIETPEGSVLRLDTRTLVSRQIIRVHGDVVDGKMTLKIENGIQKQEAVIDWAPDVLGPYGPELILSRQPMKPGDERTIKMFIPGLNKIGEARLTARSIEPVPLGGGAKRDLLRVDQVTYLDGQKMLAEMNPTYWVDSGGQVLKNYTDAYGGMVTYRTTREAAIRRSGESLDLIGSSVVKLPRKITNPESSRDVVYRITMKDDSPSAIFPADRRQTITPGADPKTATIQVKTAGPEAGTPGPDTVGPEFLRSNALITSDDAKVIALSRQAIGRAVDPWEKALAITKWVATNIREKDFETSFAPADEVARSLSGDCTEHGVLTAAMCRAQGIPAKVVVGLVYVPHLGGFGFHMWNEVYVNRRWVAIDSAFDQTQVDASHIKLSDTSLDGVSPFETFLSVARVFNKISMEAVEVR
ncbi:transglutaminase-like domain-containing protein [Tundrisphaera sp. TA3]|uniref:transglutaminase-like domain-containing protein n=1 Tax=Tundrisphaera sp. TA3 TaxID=3435775 RepID=UPI003EBE510A